MEIRRYTGNILSENCYAVSEGDVCAIIDPGFYREEGVPELLKYLDGRIPSAILLTHGHFDHVMGVKALQKLWPSVPVYMNPEDETVLNENAAFALRLGLPDADFGFEWRPVSDGQTLTFGPLGFKAIATPGHTPGGICWHSGSEGVLFSGDTLFADSIGRTDFPHGDYDSLIRSIMEKLVLLPGSTDVYPGHGGPTTIEKELSCNPFLEPFNEPEEEFDPDMAGVELHPF